MFSSRTVPNNGSYYSQMYAKFHAYQYSDADFFIHMDSDTIFKEPIGLLDFLDAHNKVYVKRIKFETMAEKIPSVAKILPRNYFLEQVPYETLTGFPFVYPRDLYQNAVKSN